MLQVLPFLFLAAACSATGRHKEESPVKGHSNSAPKPASTQDMVRDFHKKFPPPEWVRQTSALPDGYWVGRSHCVPLNASHQEEVDKKTRFAAHYGLLSVLVQNCSEDRALRELTDWKERWRDVVLYGHVCATDTQTLGVQVFIMVPRHSIRCHEFI